MPSVQQIEDKTHDFNAYYHMAGDTVDHMDADYWFAMMRGLVATIATWAVVDAAVPATATPMASATDGPVVPTATPEASEPTSTPKAAASPAPLAIELYLPLSYRAGP